MVNVNELLEKYRALLDENKALREENEILRTRLGITDPSRPNPPRNPENHSSLAYELPEPPEIKPSPGTTLRLDPAEKIRLFMSLFKGREDVYAKRWQNREGRAGYAPVCRNEWKGSLCRKPTNKCFVCPHQSYAPLDERVIEAHLRGSIVVGLYPLLQNDACHLLAIDFDGQDWQKDCTALREVCNTFSIPVALERSRSGNGAHAWFFFVDPISAALARKFGSALLTCAMSRRHELAFKSYDRFFPNQDTLPKGGFGNLIALPLQKTAREQGNSVFVDENFHPYEYEDQWGFMATIRRLSAEETAGLIPRLSPGNELGTLRKDDEEAEKPWEIERIRWSGSDFPEEVRLVKANMLYIEKTGISQRGLNTLKRLAVFRNPEFYKAQALRLPTYGKPRVISCSDETPEYLCLPRGCEEDAVGLLAEAGVRAVCSDCSCSGRPINIRFKGNLREEQVLKGVHAKYVYGLTATPTRQDGHHPIIFMHCGPIRYRVDASKQAEKRPFDHYVTPRLTSFRAPLEEGGKEPSIQRLYTAANTAHPNHPSKL